MKPLLAVGLLLLIVGAACAVPARPLYEPPDPPKAAPVFELRGSAWEGKLFNMECRITFEPDGSATYQSNRGGKGGKEGTGKWTLIEDRVTFDVNNYSQHHATISQNVMDGSSKNQTGMTGSFRLTRVPPGQ